MTDLLLDENLDLLWQDGDFVIGESSEQNQKILILSEKTAFKENPTCCVGARRFLENETPENFAREVRREFIGDGMTVDKIQIRLPYEVDVEAYYPETES